MIKRVSPALLILSMAMFACRPNHNSTVKSPVLQSDYLGQTTPTDSALLFAPNIVSTGMNERDFAITPDGNEIFFCREVGNFQYTTIFYSQRIGDIWTTPNVFEHCTNPNYKYIEPHVSPDGKKLYFISTMPIDSASQPNEDIWYSTKVEGNWEKPKNLGAPVNTNSKEFFPSVTHDGTIYYTHLDTIAKDEFIYRSRIVNGAYQQPEKLGPNVNIGQARFNAFINPDESYIIIPAFGMPNSFGGTDYYISFRNNSNQWSLPLNMGDKINSANPKEWSAAVTPNGKYLFFMSAQQGNHKIKELNPQAFLNYHNAPQNGNTDIYWINTHFIDDLRKQAKYN
ncbi:MAG: PD40 domain-containing protein [Bacteroidales bacterium]|nr:PD40 domain-containing protein [Bacteroidales bacterium]MBN2751002.1 PD40 domain-containing protein [Bacteroidales bacterium]